MGDGEMGGGMDGVMGMVVLCGVWWGVGWVGCGVWGVVWM
jgi:hypothetical protein